MIDPSLLINDAIVSFTLQSSISSGASKFTNVTVVGGVVNHELAGKLGTDIETIHKQLKPYLDPSVTSYKSYNYTIVKLSDNTMIPIGLPWIVEATFSTTTTVTNTLKLEASTQTVMDLLLNYARQLNIKYESVS